MNTTKNRQCLQLIFRNGSLSNREIGRQRHCSPTTVGRLRDRVAILGLTLEELDGMSDRQLERWLYDRPGPTGDRVWPNWDQVIGEIQGGSNRQEAYDHFRDRIEGGKPIGYRAFCKHLEPLLDRKNPSMRLLHKPGDKIMVDYAGYSPVGLMDGVERKLQLFVACLPASSFIFACVTASQKVPDWLFANEAMFRSFGGVTAYLVSDNLRAAVTHHRRGKPPLLNPTFVSFAEHFGTALAPARPYKPRDKASVESHVNYVQRALRHALQDRPVLTITQMNELLRDLVARINARALRRSVNETRAQTFARLDKPALASLPNTPFTYFTEKRCKLQSGYHVERDGVFYSAPHRLISCLLTLRASRDLIQIFHDGKLVAVHRRRWERGSPVTDPDHMPQGHREWRAKELGDLVLWSSNWSEAVQTVMQAEAAHGYSGRVRQQQFEVVDRLARAYGRDAFERACRHACEIGNPTIAHVRGLLTANRQGLPISASPPAKPLQRSGNVRGAAYYAGEG